jgi:CheY-like chemotaxis protein
MNTNIEAAKAHLLVVDDDPEMRTLIGRMLHREGHVVVEAANGREALKHLDAQAFDLVVSDLFMPDTDGIELVREIPRRRPGTPVLVLSGADDSVFGGLLAAAKMLGAVEALPKPISAADLRGAVRAALDRAA